MCTMAIHLGAPCWGSTWLSSTFRYFVIPFVGLLLTVTAAVTVGSVGASGSSEPVAGTSTSTSTSTVLASTTTVAPATTTSTIAPPVKAAKAEFKPKVKVSVSVTTAAPVEKPTEIGTACVMTRAANGSITSEGC